jgi:hypothetical protein
MKISASRPLTIQKEQHRATIYLNAYRILGTVHLQVGGRVSDFVNWNLKEGPFIPLTDVSVYTVDTGELLFTTVFLAVHRNQINFMAIDKKEPAPHSRR